MPDSDRVSAQKSGRPAAGVKIIRSIAAHDTVICIYDSADNLIATHEQAVEPNHDGAQFNHSEPFSFQICSVQAERSLFVSPQ